MLSIVFALLHATTSKLNIRSMDQVAAILSQSLAEILLKMICNANHPSVIDNATYVKDIPNVIQKSMTFYNVILTSRAHFPNIPHSFKVSV